MNSKHRKTLQAIFAEPTSATLAFADIETLILAIGGEVHERKGSRVKMLFYGQQWRCHRPHPGKEARRYQIEEIRALLVQAGVTP